MPDPTQTAAAQATKAAAEKTGVQVHELDIDGVRGFWAPGHGSMHAGLIFGVGEADERFGERGFTTLIKRLVEGELGEGAEVVVGASETTFSMSGHRAEISQFFRALLRSLRSLPLHDADGHATALLADSLLRENPARSEAMSIAYGYDGPGVLALAATGLLQLDTAAIDAWRRTYFIKNNAAAFFHGPHPQDISFAELPAGIKPTRSLSHEVLNSVPLEYRAAVGGPSLYAPIEAGRMAAMAVDMAVKRLVAGLANVPGAPVDLQVALTELGPQSSWLSIESRAQESQHQEVFDVLGTQLNRLASNGPELEEVLDVVKSLDAANATESSDAAFAQVLSETRCAVLGEEYVPYAVFRGRLATLNRSAITEPLAQSLSRAIWAAPHSSPSQPSGAQPVPPWFRQIAGDNGVAPLASRIQSREGDLVLHYEGISQPVTITLENVSGVAVANDGEVAMYHEAGLIFRSNPSALDAEDAVRMFLLELPVGVLRKVPERLVISAVPQPQDEAPESHQSSEPVSVESVAPGEISRQAVVDQAGSGTEVAEREEQDDQSAGQQRSRLLLRRGKNANADEQVTSEEADAGKDVLSDTALIPNETVTYSYPAAVQFAEAIVSEAWPMAERLYGAASSPDEQSHLVAVGSSTGGLPSKFDSWVETTMTPGLAHILRGMTTMKRAWAVRDQEAGKLSKKGAQVFWTELQAAEADILLATVELPESPVPWVPLLKCSRGLQRPRRAIEQQYINHVERGALLAGHLEFQQYMSKKWLGSNEEMWDHVSFVTNSAPDGSSFFAVAAMAFIEEWVDKCQSGQTNAEDASEMLADSGRSGQLIEAANRCFGHPDFDLLAVSSAKALEIFFAYFWAIGDFVSAAAVSAKMGRRYSGHPMSYFTNDPWPVVRATARNAAKAVRAV